MKEPSGRAWCARFPTSNRLEDLVQPFQGSARAFIDALKASGASVSIAATYRPAERAYLMHWCCMIGGSGQDPATVPAMAGVDIDWTHGGNVAEAGAAARDMMAGYDIAFPAALVSRHTQRRAIDMTIAVPAGAKIKDHAGVVVEIPKACTGEALSIVVIGKTFGVIKLASDPPHWSDDGH